MGANAATMMEQEHVYDADAGSVSDFTVITGARHDGTKTITQSAKQMMAVVPASDQQRIFERERPVNIRKDIAGLEGRANAKRNPVTVNLSCSYHTLYGIATKSPTPRTRL
jgi:hypothetical protein